MTAQEQSALHDILEECYDVQLELSDLGESYELLICDIEIVIEEIRENLERVQAHLQKVEDTFLSFNRQLQGSGNISGIVPSMMDSIQIRLRTIHAV